MWRHRLKWVFVGWVVGALGVGLLTAALGVPPPYNVAAIGGTWLLVTARHWHAATS